MNEPEGWATGPQETRERTCEYTQSPLFSVFHTLRVARSPAPGETTVSRSCEVSVEWTTHLNLPDWLAAVADCCTPYDGNRFGDGDGSAVEDGRFRSAPADATVRPPGGTDPALSDPYHYWNTSLGRLQADENFPTHASALTVDLVEGPDALWTGESTAGAPGDQLKSDRESYARVGLEFTGRERVRQSAGDCHAPVVDARSPDREYHRVGESTTPAIAGLDELVDATLAPELAEGRDVVDVLSSVEGRVDGVWSAFRWDGDREPYGIPERAVESATSPRK
jgi:hypothetical protein